MPRILVEVIVRTVADARAATEGGADRLEVVRAIRDGGLTPARDLVAAIARATSLPLRVMLRENAGYDTSLAELDVLRSAAAGFANLGVSGLVAGFARAGRPLLDELSTVIEAAPGVPVTFHRAFDSLADPLGAIDRISRVPPVDRILASGGKGSATERCEALRAYAEHATGRLTIIAGGGVDAEMFATLVRAGAVNEVHVGRAARDGRDAEGPVSAVSVRRLRDLADRHA